MQAEHTRPSWARAVRVTVLCLALWWLPVVLVAAWLGWGGTHAQQGVFFSQAAVVTFGGLGVSVLLSLFVLPLIYYHSELWRARRSASWSVVRQLSTRASEPGSRSEAPG